MSAAAPGAQLFQVVQTLFSPTATESQQREANSWLEQYARHPDSWSGCRAALEQTWHASGNVQLAFFIMNILYQKVKREANTLPANFSEQINNWLVGAANAIAQGTLDMHWSIVLRLCETMAASAALQPQGGMSRLMNQALGLLAGQPPKASALRVAVELLRVLPAETEQAVVKSAKLEELRAELGSHMPKVVGVVSTILLQRLPFLPVAQCKIKLCVATLKCITAWVPAGMSLASLAVMPGNILGALFNSRTIPYSCCPSYFETLSASWQSRPRPRVWPRNKREWRHA